MGTCFTCCVKDASQEKLDTASAYHDLVRKFNNSGQNLPEEQESKAEPSESSKHCRRFSKPATGTISYMY